MKKGMKYLVLLLSIALISCAKPERVVVETFENNNPKLVEYVLEKDGKKITVGQEQYYEEGSLKSKGDFDELGNRDGRWEYYFNNGKLWSVGEYKNGEMHGIKEVYWPDGHLRYKGHFTNNEKSGHWVFYNPDGSVLKDMELDVKPK